MMAFSLNKQEKTATKRRFIIAAVMFISSEEFLSLTKEIQSVLKNTQWPFTIFSYHLLSRG